MLQESLSTRMEEQRKETEEALAAAAEETGSALATQKATTDAALRALQV